MLIKNNKYKTNTNDFIAPVIDFAFFLLYNSTENYWKRTYMNGIFFK